MSLQAQCGIELYLSFKVSLVLINFYPVLIVDMQCLAFNFG